MILPLARVFEGRLMLEWWDCHEMAGPRDGLALDSLPPVAKPTLRICKWNGDVLEVMPEAAMKFTTGSDAAEEWKARVQEFTEVYSTTRQASPVASGPDFTSEGLACPLDPTVLVDVPPRSADADIAVLARTTSRFEPVDVVLEKGTGNLYLMLTSAAAEDELEVGPCELFGFGLGTFTMKSSEEARAMPLPCLLPDDCTLVVCLPEDAVEPKRLVPLATALFGCERYAGVSDVKLQGHALLANGRFFSSVQRESGVRRVRHDPERRCGP